MACKPLQAIPDLNRKGIRFEGDFSTSALDRKRVAIGLVGDLTVGVHANRGHLTAFVGGARQRQEECPLLFPRLSNGFLMACDGSLILFLAAHEQLLV